MRRRDFIALAGASLAWSLPVAAQAPFRKPLVAYLAITTPEARNERLTPFRSAMKSLGWIEGENYNLEIRSTEGNSERLPSLAQELITLKPDVFVGEGTRGVAAGASATTVIPVVGPSMGEATAVELAGSNFAHPKANVTGLLFAAAGNVGKLFELAHEMMPRATRFALLNDTTLGDLNTGEAAAAARALDVSLVQIDATAPTDVPRPSKDA